MTEFASGKWGPAWSDLKKDFEKNTGKKKPSEKVGLFFRKSTGIESALKDCDAYFKAFGETTDSKKKLDAASKLRAALAKTKTATDAYLKTLSTTIKGEKDADSDYTKGLQVLDAGIEALVSSIANQADKLDAVNKSLSVKELMAATMRQSVDAAVKRAVLFAKKVQATPTPAVFNAGIKDAARDITQNLGNVNKLRSLGYDFPAGDPTNLFTVLTPWANNKRDQSPDADAKTVLRELGAFVQVVNGVALWLKK
jgi:hypothetical protein